MNDPNFTEVMAYISSSFSPLVNINRRVVNLESPQTRHGLFSFDDVGNVDYTGIEPKYTLNQSEFIWDSDLSKCNNSHISLQDNLCQAGDKREKKRI